MIQQQCSERRAQTGRETPHFLRGGSAVFHSDHEYGRFLRAQLESQQDVFSCAATVRGWLISHLTDMAEAMGAGDRLVFTGELFSSEEVPELTVWSRRMPASLVRHLVAQGRALPASNPTAILRLVRRDPQLRSLLGSGAWTDTFIRIDAQGIHRLMYILEWQKTTAGQVLAA